ncbi:type II toxin-antitoxin system RelE/ParE family toxin [Acidipropionibacterium virtanenii]|uniref:Toxin RelE4 n=1 Tax=Acidipropionibacterium virtanenii TaxID=2057246 RepID=A0A344UPQ3_9ACTN|nr:type II toxin-antitoxin system RelE/ParE family toxin [Acidipropionibacterium virtanenii]AXE37251.1 Toxin RelE4 [Acidipropionibacterium virtanenii]
MIAYWSPQAIDDRNAIWEYASADSPRAAARLDRAFSDAVLRLVEYPRLGRPGIVEGTREFFPTGHYRLVYEIHGDEVRILALVHTARRWPPPMS